MLTGVILPAMPPNWRGVYIKGRERTAGDFPVVSLALGYELVDGRDQPTRASSSAASPRRPGAHARPSRSSTASSPDEATAQRAAEAALAGATPLPYNADKIELARVLITRAVARLASSS